MQLQRALFVDRDGVLIEDRVNFARTWDDVTFIEPAIKALRIAHEAGFVVIVITNQSSVGRKILPYHDVAALNERIMDWFRERGVPILAGYFCPHTPEDRCNCRKPKPGMLLEAADKHHIDLSQSYMLGDAKRDLEAAASAGAQGLLVLTGQGPQHYAKMNDRERGQWPAFRTALEAVRYVVDTVSAKSSSCEI